METNKKSICKKSANATADNSELEGWSKKDKIQLLKSLKKYGSNDIENISRAVSSKSQKEITEALNFYKSKAAEPVKPRNKAKPLKSTKPKNTVNINDMQPLAAWATILSNKIKYKDLVGSVPEALRLISQFEDIPKPESTGQVNFRELYNILADAMEGKLVELNPENQTLIHKCLVETALCVKELEELGGIDKILNEINIPEQDSSATPNSSREGFDIFNSIISQKAYNPLNIPKEYLRVDDDSAGSENVAVAGPSNVNSLKLSEPSTSKDLKK